MALGWAQSDTVFIPSVGKCPKPVTYTPNLGPKILFQCSVRRKELDFEDPSGSLTTQDLL